MIHVSSSCNPAVHHTGARFINGDTTVFMQLIQGNLFNRIYSGNVRRVFGRLDRVLKERGLLS
jgi:hypothetical protein